MVTNMSFIGAFAVFAFLVQGVSAAERDEVKILSVKEGESVTLDPGVKKNPNEVMKWYFNDVLIAEITGDQSKICTDDQCDERFRNRLKLDHQTGSLTIMNTRITDSGEYQLLINIIRHLPYSIITSIKSFSVSVTDSDLSPVAVAGIVAAALLVFVAAAFLLVCVVAVVAVIYSDRRSSGVEKIKQMFHLKA